MLEARLTLEQKGRRELGLFFDEFWLQGYTEKALMASHFVVVGSAH